MLLIIFDHDQSKDAFQGVHIQELMDSAEATIPLILTSVNW